MASVRRGAQGKAGVGAILRIQVQERPGYQNSQIDAGIIHLNRGCEGTAQHQMEMKNTLAKMGLPVMTFEGNMADEREFDEVRTARMIDLFVTETLGLKKIAA